MLNKQAKRIVAVVMAAAMVFTVAPVVTPQAVTAEAAAKKTVKLSKKSLKITQNKGYKLSVKNTSKKAEIKWSSSDKKVVTVKASKNKKSATVKPVATTGSAIVTAKVGKKKYNCKVTVSIAQKANRFNELVNTVASKGADQTFNIAGNDVKTKAIVSPEQSTTIKLLGADTAVSGSAIVAVPTDSKDTLTVGMTGKTSIMMSDVNISGFVTLNSKKQISYIEIKATDAKGTDLLTATSKTPVDATKVTKTSLPKITFDTVTGSYADQVKQQAADKNQKDTASQYLEKALAGIDAYMNANLGYGLSSIGFDNYR